VQGLPYLPLGAMQVARLQEHGMAWQGSGSRASFVALGIFFAHSFAIEEPIAFCLRSRSPPCVIVIMPTGVTLIGHRRFADGTYRAVYHDIDGRQHVIDDDGQRIFGPWIDTHDGAER
jgi:hypothetical protein